MINFSYSIPCLGKSYDSSQFLESFRITGLELLVYQITQSMIKSLESRISSIIFTFLLYAYIYIRLLCNSIPALLIKKRERKNSISKESQDSRQNFITPSITNQRQNQSVLIHIDCIIAFGYTYLRCFLRHASFAPTQRTGIPVR